MASFFENQHLARRNTKVLVLLYAFAVAGVILAVDLVLAGVYAWNADWQVAGRELGWAMRLRMVPKSLYVWGALGTGLVILAVSAWHILQLASGARPSPIWSAPAASLPIRAIRSSGASSTWSRKCPSPRGCACRPST